MATWAFTILPGRGRNSLGTVSVGPPLSGVRLMVTVHRFVHSTGAVTFFAPGDAVFYAGDEGGIVCQVDFGDIDSDGAYFSALTQLRIDPDHPLAREVQAYQQRRSSTLGQMHGTPALDDETVVRF